MVLVIVVVELVLSGGGGASCVTVLPVMFFESPDMVTLLVLAVFCDWLLSAQPANASRPTKEMKATGKFFMGKCRNPATSQASTIAEPVQSTRALTFPINSSALEAQSEATGSGRSTRARSGRQTGSGGFAAVGSAREDRAGG